MGLAKNVSTGKIVELFGPTVEFLTSPEDESADFCVLRGVIPPGQSVPLHSHPDTEDFVIVSGSVEGLKCDGDSYRWIEARAGDYIHIPNGTPHAWRNVSASPVVMLMITTRKLAQFFLEVGRPITKEQPPPSLEDVARFLAISARYGYWNATPEENAAVGIEVSFA